jgi:hypothetical protein
MAECKKRSDWNKWKEAIEVELASLTKREVFSSVISTPPKTFPVGFKLFSSGSGMIIMR